ncbi:MAG: ribbon-helix-helix domain-containing protein [Acidobacteriota bacterium]
MRITIRLDDPLLAETKKRAVDTGRTLTAVIEDALRASLSSRPSRPPRRRLRLTTVKGDGLQPGVDLDDTAALLDRMDGRP